MGDNQIFLSRVSLLSFPLSPLLFALLPARRQIACGQPVRIASPRPHEVARPCELLNLVFDTARAIGVMQKDAIWRLRSLRLSPYPVAEYTPADAILILGQQCIKSRLIGNRKFLESRVANLAVKRRVCGLHRTQTNPELTRPLNGQFSL